VVLVAEDHGAGARQGLRFTDTGISGISRARVMLKDVPHNRKRNC
jgi:hypothetical protein